IGAGAVVALLMACSSPAFTQAPPSTSKTAGDENARDDHSYLPPSMRSQIESASAAKTETPAQTPAKTKSLRRAARRPARREHWDYGWASGRDSALFANQ